LSVKAAARPQAEAVAWERFAAAEPDMAKLLRSLLGWIPIAYIATVRGDGSPRVHPFCPIFASDGMYIAVNPASPKWRDLANDGRFAMHALPGKRDDEFYLTGRAITVPDGEVREAVVAGAGHTVHPDDHVFELRTQYVMTAHWEKIGKPDTYPVRREWRMGAPASNADTKRAARRTREAAGSRAIRKGS
jgi:hypothetical protein